MLNSLSQAITEGGSAIVAAECAISVKQQAPLVFARIVLRVCGVDSLKILFGRCGEPELCADEILKDCTVVAADCAMGFVANDQLKICWGEHSAKRFAR